jgi:uncharacterized protein DUF1656
VRSELDLFGVYVPGLLVCGLVALLLNVAMRRGLAYAGFYRLVWHRPLFDLAMFIVWLSIVVWLTAAMGWQ